MKFYAFGKKVSANGVVHDTWDSGQPKCGGYSYNQPALTVDDEEPTTCLRCVVLSDSGKKS